MGTKKKFSRFLVWTLVLFEGISLSLVVGILYGILSRTMAREFHNKLQVSQTRAAMVLQDRLNLLETDLREISLNNTVRVSMMLGVKSQLGEIMNKQYPSADGAFYFVYDRSSGAIVPEVPPGLKLPKGNLHQLLHCEDVTIQSFRKNSLTRSFLTLCAIPIKRKDDRLGTACISYDLSRDSNLWTRLETGNRFRLLIQDGDALTDLRTGETRALSSSPSQNFIMSDAESPVKHLFLGEMIVPLRDFNGLFYSGSASDLRKKQNALILMLSGLCAAIFVLTLFVALFIARRVSDPLDNLANQALEIAQEPSNSFLREEDIRHIEFKKLAQAFNRVLTGLIRAHEELKRRAEKELHASEELYRRTLEAAPDWITMSRFRDGRYLQVNDAFCRISGYQRHEVMDSSSYSLDLFENPADRERICELLKNRNEVNGLEIRFRRKDGDIIDVLFSGRRIQFNGEDCLIEVVTDMTDRRHDEEKRARLEEQLRQAQKMEAVGTLAGGIAHDFNNLLQAIGGYSDLLLLDKNKGDTGYRELEEIKHATERASELTTQMLTFSRKVKSNLRPVDLNHEIKQVHKLLTRTIPKMIEIDLRLADDLKTINADPAQMEQMMMNLGLNARDAMPARGKWVLKTGNVTLDDGFCKRHLGSVPGDYVLLTASDNGHGMDKETLEHIFEPFYTTKATGKGTGLGLSMVYGIVKSHGGYIICRSEPDKGTTFEIYLPVIENIAVQEKKVAKDVPLAGDEVILLVDDEEAILDLTQKTLTRFGYRVLTASDGEEAVEIYRRKKDEIDLVILDLIMPGMGGMKCLESLHAINNRIPTIVSTGYSGSANKEDVLKGRAQGFVSKPYEAEELLMAIRNTLDGTRAGGAADKRSPRG